ncbi:MAG: hypothetical protein EXR49_03635 [Dehalococcoidia bacterium]|nr:hypothetical protein [Dehalococcoidia bacterium]
MANHIHHTHSLRAGIVRRWPVLLLGVLAALMLSSCTGGAVAPQLGWSGPQVDDTAVYIGTRNGEFVAIPNTRFLKADSISIKEKDLFIPADCEGLLPSALRDRTCVLWRFPAEKKEKEVTATYSDGVLRDGRLYVALNRVADTSKRNSKATGFVYALNAKDGAEIWDFPTAGQIFGSPAVQGDRVYVADDKGIVYAFETPTGERVWERQVSHQKFWSTPTVADGVVYIGGMDKRLYALDSATGSPVWPAPFQADGAIASKPLVAGDMIYVGAFDRTVHAVDRATGKERASFSADQWVWNDAVVKGEAIYVASLSGTIYALRASDLTELWRFPTKGTEALTGPIRSTLLISGDDLFAATRKGHILALALKDGAPDRRRDPADLDAQVLSSLSISGSKLYVSDMDQRLHQIEVRQ